MSMWPRGRRVEAVLQERVSGQDRVAADELHAIAVQLPPAESAMVLFLMVGDAVGLDLGIDAIAAVIDHDTLSSTLAVLVLVN